MQEFEAIDTSKKISCSGRACAKCGECRDWFYTGDPDSWYWIGKVKTWNYTDWRLYNEKRLYEWFQKRNDGATCWIDDNNNNHTYGKVYVDDRGFDVPETEVTIGHDGVVRCKNGSVCRGGASPVTHTYDRVQGFYRDGSYYSGLNGDYGAHFHHISPTPRPGHNNSGVYMCYL
ncbi:unnamed protein product, partial [Rotaria magnacalcarata]